MSGFEWFAFLTFVLLFFLIARNWDNLVFAYLEKFQEKNVEKETWLKLDDGSWNFEIELSGEHVSKMNLNIRETAEGFLFSFAQEIPGKMRSMNKRQRVSVKSEKHARRLHFDSLISVQENARLITFPVHLEDEKVREVFSTLTEENGGNFWLLELPHPTKFNEAYVISLPTKGLNFKVN